MWSLVFQIHRLAFGSAKHLTSCLSNFKCRESVFFLILYSFLDPIHAKPHYQGSGDPSQYPLSHSQNCCEGHSVNTELVPGRGLLCWAGRLRSWLLSLSSWLPQGPWADGLAGCGCIPIWMMCVTGSCLVWKKRDSPGFLVVSSQSWTVPAAAVGPASW